MATDFVKLYLEANKLLIRTMVIKVKRNIDSINTFLKLKYGDSAVDPNSPTTWKYYMNIAGEYHWDNQEMYITSLDTQEKILFSKDNLSEHLATAEMYMSQSRYYYDLVDRFPEQEQLILGILNPVNKTEAINATDGTILTYYKFLVEEQEITLINELQSFIYMYLERWDVPAFQYSDNLYNTAHYAIFILNLVPKLLNLRVKRCKTPEAHTFHIREYLASHGRLDRYMRFMTLKQVLFFYRNLLYIERHSGRIGQFKTLVSKVLEDRNIPLLEFSLRQLSSFHDYKPDINVRRKQITSLMNVVEKMYFDLDHLFLKETPLTSDNPIYLDQYQSGIVKKIENSPSSVLQTKDVESAMVDYSNSFPDPLEKVLLRQWAYMATSGNYTAYITFKNPKTSEDITLSALDSFIYMYYIMLTAIGLDIVALPPFINLKYKDMSIPTKDSISSVIDRKKYKKLLSIGSELVSRYPRMKSCKSIKAFYKLTYSLYDESLLHWFNLGNTGDLDERGYLENMILTLYKDQEIEFDASTKDMSLWLKSKGLPNDTLSYNQSMALITNIFKSATGWADDETKQLKYIQKAMIDIMTQLSSYSIQFIREINLSNIVLLNWKAIRFKVAKSGSGNSYYIPIAVGVIETKGTAKSSYHLESDVSKDFNYYSGRVSNKRSIDFKLNGTVLKKSKTSIDYTFPSFTITTENPVGSTSQYSYLGHFMSLTDEQKQSIY